MALPRTLTVPQAHNETGIPVRSIYDAVARGELPAIRLGETGRAVRLLEDDVRAWIKTRRERATQ